MNGGKETGAVRPGAERLLRWQVATLDLGGILFDLHGSRISTVNDALGVVPELSEAADALFRKTGVWPEGCRPRPRTFTHTELCRAYASFSGDDREPHRLHAVAVRRAVAYRVDLAWYEHHGETPSARLRAAAADATTVARRTVASDDTPSTTMSAAQIIREGLLADEDPDELLRRVRDAHSDSAADARTLAYYRSQLRREGLLAPARRGRAA